MRVLERVEHFLRQQVAREDFRDQDIDPPVEFCANGEFRRRLGVDRDAIRIAVLGDDLLGHVGDHRLHLARHHFLRPGTRRHQGQQAAACADIEDARFGSGDADRGLYGGLERIVARRVVHHRDVPERHRSRAEPSNLMAQVQIVWLQRERPAEMPDRFKVAPGIRQDHGKIADRDRIVGVNRASALERGDRLGGAAEPVQRQSLFMQRHGMFGLDREKLVPGDKGIFGARQAPEKARKQRQHFRRAISLRQHCTIMRFGAFEIPLFVQRHCFVERRACLGQVVKGVLVGHVDCP